MPRRKSCTGPRCTRPPIAHGLCPGHYAQRRRGVDLSPLRRAHGQLGDEPLLAVGELHVSAACALALRSTGAASPIAAARLVLEAWALTR